MLVRDRLDADGAEPAAELVKIARAAEKVNDLGLAADCWGKLATFLYPRPKPVEIDPAALIELEEKLAEIRGRHTAAALKQASPLFGLAERIERARAALDEEERAARTITPARPVPIASPAPAAPAAEPAELPAVPAPAPAVEPRPLPAAAAQIIAAAPVYQPLGLWPEPVAQCSTEYDVFSAYGLD